MTLAVRRPGAIPFMRDAAGQSNHLALGVWMWRDAHLATIELRNCPPFTSN
jgi:hypothetical protein